MNAADTLVQKYPTREAQLQGPVLQYLKNVSKNLKFNSTDQDLYMAVFYPAYRRVPPTTLFPEKVQKYNPGIVTVSDYVAYVNRPRKAIALNATENAALNKVASELNVSSDSLYKLINFESTWNPTAKNDKSGARGLIQFMPKTAEGMGFKGSVPVSIGGVFLLAIVGYWFLKNMKW